MNPAQSRAGLAAPDSFPTIVSVIECAQRVLPADAWNHLAGGAGSEVTLRRNRDVFDRIALRPRLMRDGRGRHTRTTFLGESLDLPVMLAPIGSIARFHPGGAVACASVAETAGTVAFVSCLALPMLERVRVATSGPFVTQIYLRGSRSEAARQLGRAEALGCLAVCLTADLAAPGRRDRQRTDAARIGRLPVTNTDLPSQRALDELFCDTEPFTWHDVETLRAATRLPLILKGVTCSEDARIGLECGVDVIYVSNHGGRLIDHVPSTIEILPEVVGEVNGRAEVIVDSGFVRGSDVVKAIALGARAVLIGKLTAWGLAAGGVSALARVLELLQCEIAETMAHLGVRSLDEVDPTTITPTFAPRAEDWIGFAPGGTERA